MDIDQPNSTSGTARTGGLTARSARHVLRIATCLTMIITISTGSEANAVVAHAAPMTCCPTPTNRAAGAIGPVGPQPPIVVDRPTKGSPDQVADYTGGIAARLRRADGTLVPGHLYLMMATVGSDEQARLFEQTPYTHDSGAQADTIESNQLAVAAAEAITGNDIEHIEFTTAPGGGPSGGLTYLIAYLNIVSGGAFTADLRVAATGELEHEGYIGLIRAANEKVGAAQLSGADVFFTSTDPSHAALNEHAGRHVGQFHTRYGRVTLAVERRLDEYAAWGATAPNTLDVVSVGHIADVAAYFCGAGSDYACSIAAHLGTTITSDTLTAYDLIRLATNTAPTDLTLVDPSPGSVH